MNTTRGSSRPRVAAMPRVCVSALVVLLTVGGTATSANAQRGLASRIEAVKSGRVRLTFAAREGVCGNGMSWFRTRNGSYTGSFNGNWSGSRDVEATCDRGPVRLVLVRVDGETTELRTYVGGRWKADTGITDLGNVSAPEAGAWLLQLAESGPVKPARGSEGDRSPRPTAAAACVISSNDRVARPMKMTKSMATTPMRAPSSTRLTRCARAKGSANSSSAVDDKTVHGGDARLTYDAMRVESCTV